MQNNDTFFEDLRIRDAVYLRAVVDSSREALKQLISKLQDANENCMTEWSRLFNLKVTALLEQRKAGSVDARRSAETMMTTIQVRREETLRSQVEDRIATLLTFGFPREDMPTVQIKFGELIDEYLELRRIDDKRNCSADIEDALRQLTDRTLFDRLHDLAVAAYRKEDARRIESFQRSTEAADKYFASFIEFSDKKFLQRLALAPLAERGVMIEERDKRRNRLLEDKNLGKEHLFRDTYEGNIQGNEDIIRGLDTICLSCSIMKSQLEEMRDECR